MRGLTLALWAQWYRGTAEALADKPGGRKPLEFAWYGGKYGLLREERQSAAGTLRGGAWSPVQALLEGSSWTAPSGSDRYACRLYFLVESRGLNGFFRFLHVEEIPRTSVPRSGV